MKVLFTKRLWFLLAFAFVVLSCGRRTDCKYVAGKEELHKVVKIDSIENVYLIYTKRHDSIFKIMSLKAETKGCEMLRECEYYNLLTKSYFPENTVTLELAGVEYHGVEIHFERDSINDLYVVENLKGLCLQ